MKEIIVIVALFILAVAAPVRSAMVADGELAERECLIEFLFMERMIEEAKSVSG